MIALLWLLACGSGQVYIVEGTVVEVTGPDEVVVEHDEIAGYMDAMTMPFRTVDASILEGVQPGDRITARLSVDGDGNAELVKLRVLGHGAPPAWQSGPPPLRAGVVLPPVDVPTHDGGSWTIGQGQGNPTLVTFLYTTCPIPEFCPATVAKLQRVQEKVPAGTRLLAVTLDPSTDTTAVLSEFATNVGAKPEVWRFGRLDKDALDKLAMRAALPVSLENGTIMHGLRWLVLDKDGRLVERYDDDRWPEDRVLRQLATGGPPAPADSDGTLTPKTEP